MCANRRLEPFDEFEEWHATGAHYFLLTASNGLGADAALPCETGMAADAHFLGDGVSSEAKETTLPRRQDRVCACASDVRIEGWRGAIWGHSAVSVPSTDTSTAGCVDLVTFGGYGRDQCAGRTSRHEAARRLASLRRLVTQPEPVRPQQKPF